jgi:hypothetical protein
MDVLLLKQRCLRFDASDLADELIVLEVDELVLLREL